MTRPFTRAQAKQNAAFLAALRRTGNARLAAAELGVHRATYAKRRARSAAFAQQWEAALAFAHAALAKGSGDTVFRVPASAPRDDGRPLRTLGGEPHLVRARSGRLQLRRAPAGRMTKSAEQAFLSALSACANIRLAAAAAGFAHSSFYARARASPAFAREMRCALALGYQRVELAALQAALPESHADDAWRHNDPPPVPRMTADQALQLLCLHEKSVRQSWEQPHRRRRRGESDEIHRERLAAMWTAEKRREAENAALARAARLDEKDRRHDDEFLPELGSGRGTVGEADGGGATEGGGAAVEGGELPPLPSLDQVTGWSKAKGRPKHNESRGMFGGWRLEDWERRDRGK